MTPSSPAQHSPRARRTWWACTLTLGLLAVALFAPSLRPSAAAPDPRLGARQARQDGVRSQASRATPVRVAQEEPSPTETPREVVTPPQGDGPMNLPYAPLKMHVQKVAISASGREIEGVDERGVKASYRVTSPQVPVIGPGPRPGRVAQLAPEQWVDLVYFNLAGEERIVAAIVAQDARPDARLVCLRQSPSAVVSTLDLDREIITLRDFLYARHVFSCEGTTVINPDGSVAGLTGLKPGRVVDALWRDTPAPPLLVALRIVR